MSREDYDAYEYEIYLEEQERRKLHPEWFDDDNPHWWEKEEEDNA